MWEANGLVKRIDKNIVNKIKRKNNKKETKVMRTQIVRQKA